jgi:hypothetical protein
MRNATLGIRSSPLPFWMRRSAGSTLVALFLFLIAGYAL